MRKLLILDIQDNAEIHLKEEFQFFAAGQMEKKGSCISWSGSAKRSEGNKRVFPAKVTT